jgi:hypothetical protein
MFVVGREKPYDGGRKGNGSIAVGDALVLRRYAPNLGWYRVVETDTAAASRVE